MFLQKGVTQKQYILGRRDASVKEGTLNIGRYLALDKSTGSDVYIDALRPHAMLICGKRGYGKSYTMGVLVEELASLKTEIRNNLAFIVIDTMGIFWTMRRPNTRQAAALAGWGIPPEGFNVEVFVPAGKVHQYAGIGVRSISISVSDLTGSDWCTLFNISQLEPLGVLLIRVIERLRDSNRSFSLSQIREEILAERESDALSRNAAANYLRFAESWGIFDSQGLPVSELVRNGVTSIVDLSSLPDQNIRGVVVSILGKKIYDERIQARRAYEMLEMGAQAQNGLPMTWMFIDEAHMFLPSGRATPASSVLINEWLRQGRQPGLSLVLATQRPSALNSEVVSQSDIILCHRLTAQDDIAALESTRPTYMRDSIGESIRNMGDEKGVAFIVDDTSESTHVVRVRPRRSWHGGDEPSAMPKPASQ